MLISGHGLDAKVNINDLSVRISLLEVLRERISKTILRLEVTDDLISRIFAFFFVSQLLLEHRANTL